MADLPRAHPCEKAIKLLHPSVCIPTTPDNRKKIFVKSDVVKLYKKSETLATTSHETLVSTPIHSFYPISAHAHLGKQNYALIT
jgi:hypothetical protein